MHIDQASEEQLQQWESELQAQYQTYKDQGLNLDLTRGKPSAQQLDLSNSLDGILAGDYRTAEGVDVRNYGGLEGIPEARSLGAQLLQTTADEVLVGGNASLTLMYQNAEFALLYGPGHTDKPWGKEAAVKMLCPVPGYDRHFEICKELGIEMINVPMTANGPDMDIVEGMIAADTSIKGMWCVPKYSNPTGIIYSDETVERIAKLGLIAPDNFRVFWDNAYSVHDLIDNPATLPNVTEYCRQHSTENTVIQFASTSKITFAGAGISFMGASAANLSGFKKHLMVASIGPDKVNQLRHARFFPDAESLRSHMKKHAALIKPKFDMVLKHLDEHFSDNDFGSWEKPDGGYFISFDTRPGLAAKVVKLSADAGVKLTPAGATFPYGNDPEDRNIRLAPTLPIVDELDQAMRVFVVCVKLASVQQQLTVS